MEVANTKQKHSKTNKNKTKTKQKNRTDHKQVAKIQTQIKNNFKNAQP